MSEYRFHLQKYSYGSKISCPNCGKSRCFVRYVDEEQILSANATMRTHAGIIIRHGNIFTTILRHYRLGFKAYRSSLARP